MIIGSKPKKETILGIDLGTGSLKVVLVDLEGNQLGHATVAYPTQSPHAGWAQQNPDDWLTALETAVPTLFEKTGTTPEQIRSIGLCGAAHISVLLDRHDRPTHPSILWNDCRSVREVEFLESQCDDLIIRKTANKVGCAWTLPQLVWLRNHVPEAVDRAETFLTSKDFLVYMLTGEKACDTSSATATMLYDPELGRWVGELIDRTGLSERAFPDVFNPARIVGGTTKSASRFGLTPGIPVISGCLDSVAEMIAAGGRNENDCVLRLGTAGAILVLGGSTGYVEGLYNYPFPNDGLSIFQAGTSSCGRSLDWIRELLSASREEIESVSKIPPGSDGLFFLPFLQGERVPYFNPELRGGLIGLSSSHRREHVLRAVMEGVAFSLLDCIVSTGLSDSLPDLVRVVGGGTRLRVWMTILSNVLGRNLQSLADADSAFGVAVLASRACSPTADGQQVILRPENGGRTYLPESQASQSYGDYFETYRAMAHFLDSLYRSAVSV